MKDKFIWDKHSDQPFIIKDRAYKKRMKRLHAVSYFRLLATNLLLFPLLLLSSFFIKRNRDTYHRNTDLFALCVNLDKGPEQLALVRELGCRHIQIRLPLSDIENIEEYVLFAKSFSECHILINILQDREHIDNSQLLGESFRYIFSAFDTVAHEFQIGNAINRTKWCFFSVDEYLSFYQKVQRIRDEEFPSLCLVGPSVIDYEYHFTIRALFNGFRLKFDKLSSLLYVDRRGAPENTQMGVFNTCKKVDFLHAIATLSKKVETKILITEANWPISNTAPWAPTSETECVDEEVYANYLLRYYLLVMATQKVERVYWHQLIAPGYGLIDSREDIRKRTAFYVYKKMVENLQNATFIRYENTADQHHVFLQSDEQDIEVVWLNSEDIRRYDIESEIVQDKVGDIIEGDIYLSASPIYLFKAK